MDWDGQGVYAAREAEHDPEEAAAAQAEARWQFPFTRMVLAGTSLLLKEGFKTHCAGENTRG